jgi:hypothetical protein
VERILISFYDDMGIPSGPVVDTTMDNLISEVDWHDHTGQGEIYMSDDSKRFYVMLGPKPTEHYTRWITKDAR